MARKGKMWERRLKPRNEEYGELPVWVLQVSDSDCLELQKKDRPRCIKSLV